MILLLTKHRKAMVNNGLWNARKIEKGEPPADFRPVVKLFCIPAATWLLTELDPRDHNLAYGLIDLGVGRVELGWVSMTDLEAIRVSTLRVERDRFWKARATLSEYAREAMLAGRIPNR